MRTVLNNEFFLAVYQSGNNLKDRTKTEPAKSGNASSGDKKKGFEILLESSLKKLK